LAVFVVIKWEGGDMSRTSTVLWSLIGVVVATLGVLGLIYGPGLYREGKAVVGPIVELTKIEDDLAHLNDEFPFSVPPDGEVGEERLSTFLGIRRELQPKYKSWDEMIHRVDESDVEDWNTAKEVLGETQDVMVTQVTVLREHRMSPAEFVWIEELVYGTWAEAVAGASETTAVADEVRRLTTDDLVALDDLERRYGRSKAIREYRSRLEARMAEVDEPIVPVVGGVSEMDAKLFWERRDEIAELNFAGYADLHEAIGGAGDVEIKISAN
jgi:hypothetical protein